MRRGWFEDVEEYQELLSIIPKPIHPSEAVSSPQPHVLTPRGGVGLGYFVHVLRIKSRHREAPSLHLGQSERSFIPSLFPMAPRELPRSLAARLPFTCAQTHTGQWPRRSVNTGHP